MNEAERNALKKLEKIPQGEGGRNLEKSPEKPVGRIERIITHDGPFHTDEVFATAILKDLFPESMDLTSGGKVDFVKYLRSRDKNLLEAALPSRFDMLVDVGADYDFSKYNLDHHQKEGAGRRENGIAYATAGLVWKHFGQEWIKYIDSYSRKLGLKPEEIKMISRLIDEKYVQLIDANDTGQLKSITHSVDKNEIKGDHFTLAEIVRLANVDVHDGKNIDEKFREAVEIFRNLTLAMANKYIDLAEGLRKFDITKCELSDNRKTVIINQTLPPTVTGYLIQSRPELKSVEFYACLTDKDTFAIMPAPVEEGAREYRNPNMIPRSLRLGTETVALNKKLEIDDGVIFSHSGGFFASCKDLNATRKFLAFCASDAELNPLI